MPIFSYNALNVAGEATQGQIEAPTKNLALDMILSSGQTPTDIKVTQSTTEVSSWFERETPPLSAADTGSFAGDLSRLLTSGFSLYQALQMVGAATETKAVRELSDKAARHVNTGGKLSDVLSKEKGAHIQTLAGLIKAGEASGELQTILTSAGESFRRSAEFKEKLTSALIYPMIILFMISLTLIVFFSFVLPKLAPLFEDVGDRLPMATKLLLGFGLFVEQWMPWIGIGALIGYVALQLRPHLKTKATQWWHARLMGRLGFGTQSLSGFATYTRTLGLLLSSGVPLPSAHDVASGSVRNTALNAELATLSTRLREGQPLTKQLETVRYAPDILVRMVSVGERTGKLDAALMDAAGILERKAQTRTDRLLAALTPALTIFLGLLVTLVVGSLFLGIASLTDVQI